MSFSYTHASVSEIVERFKKLSGEQIYNVRYSFSGTSVIWKIEEALQILRK